MTEPIYRWSGEYFGFIYNGRLFDKYTRYLGWLEADEVWNADGSYLGELYKRNYILREISGKEKPAKVPMPAPPRPPRPEMKRDRIARTSREGYKDALDAL